LLKKSPRLLVWYKATYRLLSEHLENTLRDACYSPCGQWWNLVLARGSHAIGSLGHFGWLWQYKRRSAVMTIDEFDRVLGQSTSTDKVLSLRLPKGNNEN